MFVRNIMNILIQGNFIFIEFIKMELIDKSDLQTHKKDEDGGFYDLKFPHMTLMKLKNHKEAFFDVAPILS